MSENNNGGYVVTNFSLSSLIPERVTFTDDMPGAEEPFKRYDVQMSPMLGPKTVARMSSLQNELPGIMEGLAKNQMDETAVARVDTLMNEMFSILVPGMPIDRVSEIPFGYKSSFVAWYQKEDERLFPKAKARQAKITKLPSSSTQTKRRSRA